MSFLLYRAVVDNSFTSLYSIAINIVLYFVPSEPEAKKMATLVADPLMGIRGGPGSNSSLGDSGSQASRPQTSSSVGGICNEDIRVPDKMVGLSK